MVVKDEPSWLQCIMVQVVFLVSVNICASDDITAWKRWDVVNFFEEVGSICYFNEFMCAGILQLRMDIFVRYLR